MIPQDILEAYYIGTVKSVKPISIGLIHQTYKVVASEGSFVFQRLHPVLESEGIGKDFFVITTFLNDQAFPAPKCVLSKKLKILVKDTEGHKWRVQTFLQGKTFTTVESPKMAKEAGALFGSLHTSLSFLRYEFKSKKILHETDKIFASFQKLAKKYASHPLMEEVQDDVVFVLNEMKRVTLPVSLPLRAIHGDPKISNLLFDDKGNASAVVDLDTCNRRPLLVETGDMFRSWCGKEEDDVKNQFRLAIFKAGWTGYVSSADGFISKRERALVPLSVATITLELTTRFLADYFQDSYFGWNEKRYSSRRAHNLARARGQLALYRSIWKHMDAMKKIVSA